MNSLLDLHPILLASLIGLAVSIGFFLTERSARSKTWKTLNVVAGMIVLLPAGFVILGYVFFLTDPRIRTYKAFYDEIQIGMNRNEVFQILERCYPRTGRGSGPRYWKIRKSCWISS
jgi:hypothetical protein